MAARRKLYLHPNAETKSAWAAVGASTDLAAVSKGYVPPALPPLSSYIESTTNAQAERFTFPRPNIPDGFYVSYVRAWVCALTQSNHSITIDAAHVSGATYHAIGASGASLPEAKVIPASQPVGWYSTSKLSPVTSYLDGNTYLDAAALENAAINIGLTESGAQAGTSRVYAVVLEVGISTMEHLVARDQVTFGPVVASEAGFFGAHTDTEFRCWGYQYENNDFWANQTTARNRLLEMREHQANTLRVHVPFGPYMTDATTPNETKFAQFERFLDQCEGYNVRLDVTGLNLYDPALRPAWLDALSESARWATFGVFWKRLAQSCAGSPAVVFYGLINEPAVPGGVVTEWYGGNLGGFDYFAFLVKDPGVRSDEDIIDDWFDVMETAIRAWDPMRAMGPCHPFAGGVDQWHERATVILAHIYASNTPSVQLDVLRDDYYSVGKPVVLEESGSLGTLTAENNKAFWIMARPYVAGTLTNWTGYPVDPEDPDIPFTPALQNAVNTRPFLEASAAAMGEELERFWLDGVSLFDDGWMLKGLRIDAPEKRPNTLPVREGVEVTGPPEPEPRTVELRLEATDGLPGLSPDRAHYRISRLRRIIEEATLLAAEGEMGKPLLWQPAGTIEPGKLWVLGGTIVEVPKSEMQGDAAGYYQGRPTVVVSLICRPYVYGEPITTTATSASGPMATVTVADVLGEVDADAIATIKDATGADRRFVDIGGEQRTFGLTALEFDSDAVSTTGYSGSATTRTGAYDPNASGNSVIRATPLALPITVCGMSGLTHEGRFRVRARLFGTAAVAGVIGSSPTIRVRFRWRVGQGDWHVEPWVDLPVYGAWCEPELGSISLPRSSSPSWDWELDVVANGGSVETLDFDVLTLMPTGIGYMQAKSHDDKAPSLLAVADDFNSMSAAASINARSTPIGAKTWASSTANVGLGGTTAGDFTAVAAPATTGGGMVLQKNSVSDNGMRRVLLPDTIAAVDVQALFFAQDWWRTYSGIRQDITRRMLIARYVSNGTYLGWGTGTVTPGVHLIAHRGSDFVEYGGVVGHLPAFTWVLLRLIVYTDGNVFAGCYGATIDSAGKVTLGTTHYEQTVWIPECVTGALLDDGQVGFEGYSTDPDANLTLVDNFRYSTAPPAQRPALPAGRRIRFGTRTENPAEVESTVQLWDQAPHRGTRFKLPAAGVGEANTRLAWRARRTNIDEAESSNLTDASELELEYVPRYWDVPRPM